METTVAWMSAIFGMSLKFLFDFGVDGIAPAAYHDDDNFILSQFETG
jgi:hypothetical protein